jgi:hypothetical protein
MSLLQLGILLCPTVPEFVCEPLQQASQVEYDSIGLYLSNMQVAGEMSLSTIQLLWPVFIFPMEFLMHILHSPDRVPF